jgi:hypothetical protein
MIDAFMDQFEAQESIGTTIAVLNQCELLKSVKTPTKEQGRRSKIRVGERRIVGQV